MDPRDIEVPGWLDWFGHFSKIGAIFLVIDYVATWISGVGDPLVASYGASAMQIFLATLPLTLFATWMAFVVFDSRRRNPNGWWRSDGRTGWLEILFGLALTIILFDFLGAVIAGIYWRITDVRLPFWDLVAPPHPDLIETLRNPARPFPFSALTTIERYWALLGPLVFIKAIVLGTMWGRSIAKIGS